MDTVLKKHKKPRVLVFTITKHKAFCVTWKGAGSRVLLQGSANNYSVHLAYVFMYINRIYLPVSLYTSALGVLVLTFKNRLIANRGWREGMRKGEKEREWMERGR